MRALPPGQRLARVGACGSAARPRHEPPRGQVELAQLYSPSNPGQLDRALPSRGQR